MYWIFLLTAMQTIQGIQQQQIQVQAGDRPVMPVVSMPAQPNNQHVQQAMPATIQQSIPLQPNLAVTQQPMQMGMQQIQPVSAIKRWFLLREWCLYVVYLESNFICNFTAETITELMNCYPRS